MPLLAMKMCFHCEREGGERGGREGEREREEKRKDRGGEEGTPLLAMEIFFVA